MATGNARSGRTEAPSFMAAAIIGYDWKGGGSLGANRRVPSSEGERGGAEVLSGSASRMTTTISALDSTCRYTRSKTKKDLVRCSYAATKLENKTRR